MPIDFDALSEHKQKELLKLFEKNAVLIDANDWLKVYDSMPIKWTYGYQASFTEMLYDANIDPLDYLKVIPEYYMSGSCNITSFKIPNHITDICEGAFSHASQLEECFIPDSVYNIGLYSFYQCYNLKRLFLGANIKNIGSQCFTRCDKLKKIIYNNTKENWSKIVLNDDWKNPRKFIIIECLDGQIYL